MSHPVYDLARQLFGAKAQRIPFQEHVYDVLASGSSAVLQAPTGSGKTFAALAPLVLGTWGAKTGPPARKLIYSLPLRVLAGSLKSDYEDLLGALDAPLNFTTQFGGEAHDAFLDGGDNYWTPRNGNVRPGTRHVVFTTIDQTLSGFAGIPVSLPYRLANVPYGSILSGALVFDEFHLLDPDRSFQTALHLLKQSPWPVLVMTATLSGFMREALADTLDAEVITVGSTDVPAIQSQHETVKTLHVAASAMTSEQVADHLGERTLVICNQVKRAQETYKQLDALLTERGDDRKRLLLHSRFLPEDRNDKEAKVREWFKKGSTVRAVVVATQVVEAGLDVSADVMHTDVSPIDSVLQRIGRTARFDLTHADVFVYPVHSALPYDESRTKQTLDVLRDHEDRVGVLRFEHLQGLIDAVMTEAHESIMATFQSGALTRQEAIQEARSTTAFSMHRDLVRHINNVEVVIAEKGDPEARGVSPFDYPAVSLPRSTFQAFLKEVDAENVFVVAPGDDAEEEDDQDVSFRLLRADTTQERVSSRYVVPNRLATYSKALGLQLAKKGSETFVPKSDASDDGAPYPGYEDEPYALHVERVLDQHEVRAGALDAIKRLSDTHRYIRVSDPQRVVRLMIWAHDVAKLSEGWQQACGMPDVPLAHGGRIKDRTPSPHSVEGMHAAYGPVAKTLIEAGEAQETVRCVLRAIRTHHSPQASALNAYAIPESYRSYLRDHTSSLLGDDALGVLQHWNLFRWSAPGDSNPNHGDKPEGFEPLYALLVYALRRSDGLGTSLSKADPASSS